MAGKLDLVVVMLGVDVPTVDAAVVVGGGVTVAGPEVVLEVIGPVLSASSQRHQSVA